MQVNKRKAIAEQSKISLTESLLSLMSKKDYSNITITEIAENALLSRRTFYRNFSSKEDILETYCKTLCQEYIECFKNESDLSLSNVTEIYFSFWQKHVEFLTILNKNHLMFFLLEKYNEFLPIIYKIYKGDDNKFNTKEEVTYAILFSSGGFWNILSEWLKDGITQTPKEMSEIILKFMNLFIDGK
ncbi:TetR/AcrR family transcriptional regulator [Clostridioides difficile]|nr:TetR/AcrR family transcriptional regulator [Clostridioides difficile]